MNSKESIFTKCQKPCCTYNSKQNYMYTVRKKGNTSLRMVHNHDDHSCTYRTLMKIMIQMRISASTPNAITFSMITAFSQVVLNSTLMASTIQSSSAGNKVTIIHDVL